MWIITTQNDLSQRFALSVNKEYIVGRNEADIILLDKSISRHHAKLKVELASGCLTLTDISRFGTFVNEQPIGKSEPVTISSGSRITFGSQPGITVIVECRKLSVLLSSVDPSLRGMLQLELQEIEASLLNDWSTTCDLLIMSKLIVTHKVLCALLSGVSIVHPGYITALIEAGKHHPFVEPDKSDFLPQIKEKGFSEADAYRFLMKPNRSDIFTEKVFFFLTELKMQRYQYLLNLTNARVEFLKLSPLTTKENIFNLFSEIRPENLCVIYESPTFSNTYEQNVYAVCREIGIRPILDQEIAFAIIENSCVVYCNTQASCDQRILSQTGIPKEYSFDLSFRPSQVSKRISVLKRRREEEGKEENEVLRQRMKSVDKDGKLRCAQSRSNLLPSTVAFNKFFSGEATRTEVLVPDTEAANLSTVLLADSLLGEDAVASKTLVTSPIQTSLQTTERFTDGSSWSSLLQASKKPRLSNFQQCETRKSKFPLTVSDTNNHEIDILSAFDAMPSLSSLRQTKQKRALPPSNQSEVSDVHDFSGECKVDNENIPPSEEIKNEFATAVNSRLPVTQVDPLLPYPAEQIQLQPPLKIPMGFCKGEFLSKSTEMQQASIDEPKAYSKIKLTKLYSGSACNQNPTTIVTTTTNTTTTTTATPYLESEPVNFKCFHKVWPLSDMKSNRPVLRQPAVPITLIPFEFEKKTDVAAPNWFTGSSQMSSEDAVNKANVDRLFNELCELPSLKRR